MSCKYDKICGVVLAAGKGTRMKSEKPKVLHTLLGAPMLWYVLQSMYELVHEGNLWTVIGYKGGEILTEFPSLSEQVIEQGEQLGTGHAIQCCLPSIEKSVCEKCLVVNGDAPVLNSDILQELITYSEKHDSSFAFLTIELEDPTGYGRVIRNQDGSISCIVEEKDIVDPEIRDIKEVNAGVYIISKHVLHNYLHLLSRNNKQNEYYITELIDLSVKNNERVDAYCAGNNSALLGINSPNDLTYCEQILMNKRNKELGNSGVIIRNPDTVRIGPRAYIHPDVDITGPAEIYGETEIGSGCRIQSHVVIEDSRLGSNCKLKSFSHVQEADVGEACELGPFARIRPGTYLDREVKVGNFVEVKKSKLHKGSKANHLAYLGDCEVGEDANIGAGSITCNFDGKQKHITVIGSKSFIGSNTSLVAPLTIGKDCLIAAGSTITKDVPENTLAFARERQKNMSKKFVK